MVLKFRVFHSSIWRIKKNHFVESLIRLFQVLIFDQVIFNGLTFKVII